jgi:hypothetical protein
MATAFDSFAPFDTGPGSVVSEDGWRAMMQRGSISGVIRGIGNELLPFGDSSGRQVKVPTGEAWIQAYWGGVTSGTKTLPIAANASGSTRYDLVVARAEWTTNNDVELDVITGTGSVVPDVTRNTTRWEIPLAVVTVINGASTITAAQVQDARQWGGPPVTTVTDDFLYYGDKLSTCQRINCNGDAAVVASTGYFSQMRSLGEQTVSQIRMYCGVQLTGGAVSVRIFHGYRPDQLTSIIDPVGLSFASPSTITTGTFTPVTFRAGQYVVVVILGNASAAGISLAGTVSATSGGVTNLLNPSATVTMTCGFKGSMSSMPTTLNIIDGSWGKRDRFFWASLL